MQRPLVVMSETKEPFLFEIVLDHLYKDKKVHCIFAMNFFWHVTILIPVSLFFEC